MTRRNFLLYFQSMSILDILIPAAQAHEKWFVATPAAYVQPAWYRTPNVWTIGCGVVVALLVIAGVIVDRWYEKSGLYKKWENKIRPLRDYGAGVLAMSTSIMLLYNALRGTLFASNFVLGHGLLGSALRIIEGGAAVLLLIGLYTPLAAATIIALFVPLLLLYKLPAQLELVNLFGIGAFLFFFAQGQYSLDWFLGKSIQSTLRQRKIAYFFLRVTLGIAILALAFWNKWLDPGYHLALMDRFSQMNPYVLLAHTGIFHLTREQYIFLLFSVEMVVGLFELLGIFTRVVSLLLVPIFSASVIFLPPQELIGHLPILGTLFVLFVFGDTYHKGRASQEDQKIPA